MAKKLTGFKTKGMNKDLSVSAFNPEFAFENMNLRLSTNEGNTLLSWVNEKGTEAITLTLGDIVQSIAGVPVGTAVLNHQLILFTHQDIPNVGGMDHIYKLVYGSEQNSMQCEHLFYGDLHLSPEYPLETIVSYESENIQKVYWTDGRYDSSNNIYNQPRVINVAGEIKEDGNNQYIVTQFDFVPELKLEETVTIEKILGNGGMFAPGVIQYALTYYNKYAQETNIFYTTPLCYISYVDRGASPEDKVDNSFKITVNNLDSNFDYLRIYSIQRTSINGTPLVKRIQDIEIKGLETASYLDMGTSGDSVDPTELLYKGGESLVASTLEQKDGTLFLGGLVLSNPSIYTIENLIDSIKSNTTINTDLEYRYFQGDPAIGNYAYNSQLTLYNVSRNNSLPCSGFKREDYYRLGVQFQYKTGKWSEPVFIMDKEQDQTPVLDNTQDKCLKIPVFEGSLSATVATTMKNLGYRKVRAVVVYPEMKDRVVKCQGVINPTIIKSGIDDRAINQSSWFFRPFINRIDYPAGDEASGILRSPCLWRARDNYLPYTSWIVSGSDKYDPLNIRSVEIQGEYNNDNKLGVDGKVLTLHSPDVEFDDQLSVMDFTGFTYRDVGWAEFSNTMSDISIQTESPTISNKGTGFIHRTFSAPSSYGIVSGLFYDDYYVDDDSNNQFQAYPDMLASVKWMVYPWQQSGSLNNDINRPVNTGTPSAILKKKIISNLRFASTNYSGYNNIKDEYNLFEYTPQLFSSDDVTILKLLSTSNSNYSTIYQGNVDTMLAPDHGDGRYHANAGLVGEEQVIISGITVWRWVWDDIDTDFTDYSNWTKLFQVERNGRIEDRGIYKWINNEWKYNSNGSIGDYYQDLTNLKSSVRMKYKSSPHLVFGLDQLIEYIPEDPTDTIGRLKIFEVVKEFIPETGQTISDVLFGGQSPDALRECNWIPCGEPVLLSAIGQDNKVHFNYSWGDTYFQRYDCLKTYAFTPEDENQVVEIGSFMLETHVNIDGRYDRNRGQQNNLNMSPRNFNLLNPVYSQINNFFSYKIMPEDTYRDTTFPNQITWSKTKESGADVDQWTNVTLASILELDGDKGKLNKLIRLNDQILAFQDTGISQILYNENVQISSNDGVPIEIANSGKVQGKRYLSNTIGCSNKWSMATTPAGIYFMDSHDKGIYLFNGQLTNISNQGGFNSWCKNNIFLTEKGWNPQDFGDFVAYYDKQNQDVLWINSETALAWSEKLGAFTSFYSYGGTPFFCNLDDTGVWITNPFTTTDTPPVNVPCKLWKHQAGDYCSFFGQNKPYWMTLVGNPEPQMDKIFTNLEFRACVDGEGSTKTVSGQVEFDKPYIPFDHLETWDEYQHGLAHINIRNGHSLFKHHLSNSPDASLIRKFRIWRCDIPRDNHPIETPDEAKELGVQRFKVRPMDRMRNPWLYLKLMKNVPQTGTLPRAEIHDIVMTYFS